MLRLKSDVPKADRLKRVEEMLDFVSGCVDSKSVDAITLSLLQLNLKKVEDTLIGEPGRIKGLSGGEKRRLLFASEVCVLAECCRLYVDRRLQVLSDPPLLFADEVGLSTPVGKQMWRWYFDISIAHLGSRWQHGLCDLRCDA